MDWPGTIQPARFLSHTGKVLPGVRRVVQVASPGAGNNWQVVVPGGVQWFVIGGQFTLTTDATVANRLPAMTVTVNGVGVWYVQPSNALPAGSVGKYTVVSGLSQTGNVGFASGQIVVLPPTWVPEAAVIASSVVNLDATDTLTGITLWVEEVYVTDQQLSEIARDRAQLQRDIDIYEYQQAMQQQGA